MFSISRLKLIISGVTVIIVITITYHLTTSWPLPGTNVSFKHSASSSRNKTSNSTTLASKSLYNDSPVIVDHSNMSGPRSDIVLCKHCNPVAANLSTIYRHPKGLDVEDNTAVAYNPRSLLSAPNICPKGTHQVIIAVTTHADRSLQRATIRKTWGSFLKETRSVKVVFFQGVVNHENGTVPEYLKYRDIVMDAFSTDDFGGPALQTAMVLYWLKKCGRAKLVLKVTDGTFVNIKLLLRIKDRLISTPGDVFGWLLESGTNDFRLQECAYFFKTSALPALNKATAEVLLEEDDGAYMARLARVAGLQIVHLNETGICNSTADGRNLCDELTAVTVHPVNASMMTALYRNVLSDVTCNERQENTWSWLKLIFGTVL